MESRIWYRVLRGSRGALDGTAPEKAGRGEGVTRRIVRATFLRGDCSLAVHTFVTNKRVRRSLWGAFLMWWSPIILDWMGPKRKVKVYCAPITFVVSHCSFSIQVYPEKSLCNTAINCFSSYAFSRKQVMSHHCTKAIGLLCTLFRALGFQLVTILITFLTTHNFCCTSEKRD